MTSSATSPQTLFEKIWNRAVVQALDDGHTLLFVDRHLCHEGSATGFGYLRANGRKLRQPLLTFATADHFTATTGPTLADIEDPEMRQRVLDLQENANDFGMTLFSLGDDRRGIVHVVGPEQGITQPGLLMVCGDSHTSTHGALGAFAFGVGATEMSHVLATQCLWQKRPKTMRINVTGERGIGVTAKDVILAIIARIGARGAVGYVIEYAGSVIEEMSMEERMTVCNMSIEAGGRAGMIAPDDKTFAYLRGRPYAPRDADWDQALTFWRTLPSDPDAVFDAEVHLDGADIAPMVTWGTSPQDAVPITDPVPDPEDQVDPERAAEMRKSLDYMGLTAGQTMADVVVDGVFIGSCTNGRIEDLRAAAQVLKGKTVRTAGFVAPGSGLVKAQAEAEGLDRIFTEAGLQWRESGCSMCVGMNGDIGKPQQRWASTSNRNFMGRQGPGVRTHLVSPATAAAAAVTGCFTDPRSLPLAP